MCSRKVGESSVDLVLSKKEVVIEAVAAAIEKEGGKVVEKWWVLKPKDIDRI